MSDETKPGADMISGSAREQLIGSMGAIALAAQQMDAARIELHAVLALYGKALTTPLPEAAEMIEEAVERSMAIALRVPEVFK